MTGPTHDYPIIEDDDSQDRASFWHIRDSERWVIAHLLEISLDTPRVKFNSGLRKQGMKLRDQFKVGLK